MELNETWIAGKYTLYDHSEAGKQEDGSPAEIPCEINTALPYVAIGEFFAQGRDADEIISRIHNIWLNGNCTVEAAIASFTFAMLTTDQIFGA